MSYYPQEWCYVYDKLRETECHTQDFYIIIRKKIDELSNIIDELMKKSQNSKASPEDSTEQHTHNYTISFSNDATTDYSVHYDEITNVSKYNPIRSLSNPPAECLAPSTKACDVKENHYNERN